ncbi:hypothetical protein ISN34_07945 [Xanthomonas translucens pv. translucens]|uniref:Uncharacterized protein n=2 Tax=Xanthomonas campestris pv. translucens TaxID=343 RepID=A0A125PV41_XANCT|nr:hypothetical protein ATB53_01390 [Xanthomonas translucens]QSQ36069.1 hypothetical protein ISN31_10175 [Xanthomonas translucens pv. translucens]QSQ47248.1 hypothetical protein ISN34_07945 [Xanthomonas translucens pv. translucens]
MVTLADYPVLAEIAAGHTTAKRLDRRAVRWLYRQHLSRVDAVMLDPREQQLVDELRAGEAMEEPTAEQNAEAYRIMLALAIDGPWSSSSKRDVAEWIAWWAPSARIAETMPDAECKALWASGWWPPAAPEHAGRVPPPSVRIALRFDDRHCQNTIAAYEKTKKDAR